MKFIIRNHRGTARFESTDLDRTILDLEDRVQEMKKAGYKVRKDGHQYYTLRDVANQYATCLWIDAVESER